MTPEEWAQTLFRRVISPTTGEFTVTRPSIRDIVPVLRAAVAEEAEACAAICDKLRREFYGEEAAIGAREAAKEIRARHQEVER